MVSKTFPGRKSYLVCVGHVEPRGCATISQVANSDHLLDQVLRLLERQVLSTAFLLDFVTGR
jgi:hypothetical protein